MAHFDSELIHQQVNTWLNQVVIGLNLCPFAAKPQRNGQIHIAISQATDENALLEDIFIELKQLDKLSPAERDTTLVVVPGLLSDFWLYNQFIEWVERLIVNEGWEGIYQLATFHPDYQFAGTDADDDENLTNRSPYPIFHLIREESMEKVLKHYPDPDAIPERNIERVSQLSEAERQQLFPHLFNQQ